MKVIVRPHNILHNYVFLRQLHKRRRQYTVCFASFREVMRLMMQANGPQADHFVMLWNDSLIQ